MKTWFGLVVLAGLLFGPVGPSRAEDPVDEAGADEQRLRELKELLEQSVEWYDVFPDADAKDELRPKIVMRWQNAVRTNTGAAILAIWTDRGRPEAMASIFKNGTDICHEFGSLARSKKIVVRDEERLRWSPGQPAVEFRDLPDAPVPAEDSAGRLRQMKSLAGRFTARLPVPQSGISNPEVLRLLPRPLYRYELKDSEETSPKLRDGTLFAFVMGTDPEVLLLLEAVEREGRVVWQYALARATSYAVEVSLGDAVVWSEKVQSGPDPLNKLIWLTRPLPASR